MLNKVLCIQKAFMFYMAKMKTGLRENHAGLLLKYIFMDEEKLFVIFACFLKKLRRSLLYRFSNILLKHTP